MAQNVKTWNGLAIASVKTVDSLAIASVKTILGVDNTAGGGIALVENVGAGSSDQSNVTTSVIDTTGANLLVAAVSDYGGATESTFSDSKGNTWTLLQTAVFDGSTARNRLFYSVPSSVGAAHTFTATGATSFPSVCVAAFSGANVAPADGSNSATGNGATLAPGSLTPTVDNCVLVTTLGNGETGATGAPTNFTLTDNIPLVGGQHFGCSMAYEIQTTATARNPSWANDSQGAGACIASFKP